MCELLLVSASYKPDIICLTETWLSPDIDDNHIRLKGYSLARRDRQSRKGGGVVIYARDDIYFKEVHIRVEIDSSSEVSFIHLPSICLFLMCLYIPPNLPVDTLKRLGEQVVRLVDTEMSVYPNHDVIITGDLNKFKTETLISDLGLVDIVNQPTRANNILDHILVSKNLTRFYDSDCVTYSPPIGKSDHLTIMVTPRSYERKWKVMRSCTVYDFRSSHLNSLLANASLVDWNEISDIDDVNQQWSTLHAKITLLLEESIPRRIVVMSSNDKEWLTPLTKLLIQDKWNAFRAKEWTLFHHLKEKLRKEIMKAKDIWAQKMKETPYGLWKLANKMRKDTGSIQSAQLGANVDANSLTNIIANSFARNDGHKAYYPSFCENDDWSISFSRDEVFKILQTLPHKKAGGCDNIPNKVYSLLSHFIAGALTSIFNNSISKRIFPNDWKKGIVVPIPKTRPPRLDKLRMITLLPVPSKIMEKLILRKCRAFFEALYGKFQHGFRRNTSTTTALIQIHDTLTSYLDSSSHVGAVLIGIDLSRAFDMVDHNVLLQKLSAQHVPSGMLTWLVSYLSNRTVQVNVSGCLSHVIPVTCGVPQGSVLGPALFCVLTGDLGISKHKSTYVLYADDANIILPIARDQSQMITEMIDAEVKVVTKWCEINKQCLNTGKCQAMLVTKYPVTLSTPVQINLVQSMRILGVTLTSTLSWDDHILDIYKRASRRFHFLRTMKSLTTKNELHQIYLAVIRPLLEYCSPVFAHLNKKLRKKIERIDKRAHWIIFEDGGRKCNCIGSLEQRRYTLASQLFRKISTLEDHVLNAKVPKRLRYCDKYQNPFCRTERRKNSFFPFMTLLINGDVSL